MSRFSITKICETGFFLRSSKEYYSLSEGITDQPHTQVDNRLGVGTGLLTSVLFTRFTGAMLGSTSRERTQHFACVQVYGSAGPFG